MGAISRLVRWPPSLLRPGARPPRGAASPGMTSHGFFATSAKGAFEREPSRFRNWIEDRPDAAFPPARDRYHLYISLACPWASRCYAMRNLKRLQDVIGVSIVHPVFQRTRPEDPEDSHVGWAFVDPDATPTLPGPSGHGSYSSAGATPDTVNNAAFVRDLYELCSQQATRFTVPVLWDKQQRTIVSNESADIVRMLNASFQSLVPDTPDLYPQELQAEIDALDAWIYDDINNGVYKCGFATSQEAYDDAVSRLFLALDRAEAILAEKRFLVGDRFTEADLRLFATLVRFDQVYFVHFKTNKKRIADYPNLSNYMRDIYQHPAIKPTVNMQHIKFHYYGSHTHLNPYGIVPTGGDDDLDAKHDRDRLKSIQWITPTN